MGKRKCSPVSHDELGSPRGFRDFRGASKDVSARAYARRSSNLTAKQSTAVLGRIAAMNSDDRGVKRTLSDIAGDAGRARQHLRRRLIDRATDESRGDSPLAYQVSNEIRVVGTIYW